MCALGSAEDARAVLHEGVKKFLYYNIDTNQKLICRFLCARENMSVRVIK